MYLFYLKQKSLKKLYIYLEKILCSQKTSLATICTIFVFLFFRKVSISLTSMLALFIFLFLRKILFPFFLFFFLILYFLSRGLPLFFDNMQVNITNFMLIVIHCYYMIYPATFGMYVLKYRGSTCSFSLCTRSKRLLHVRTKLSCNKNIFKRTKMLMNTPVYLDLSILEMNEIVIYKFGMIT